MARMPRAESDVTAIRAELSSAQAGARRASELSSDARVSDPAQRAVDLLEQALAPSPGDHEPPEQLTVALLGRTKAGKSQLVAALTGDPEGSGVGVGRHRTTTQERVVHLPEFDLIDLPGVAALNGEEDTELALTMAERADAVLWIYAESLQDAEACELEDLMRQGKPVVVAFNVKQSIGNEGLRKVFTKYPGRTFRDLESHKARVAQIADRAGTHEPPFVAFHARAAWLAEVHGDPDLARASRVQDLTAACESVLVSRASVLRIRADHDRPRQRLVELGAAARLVASELGDEQADLSRLINWECDAIVDRAVAIHRDAITQLDAAVAQAKQGLGGWLAEHRRDDDQKLNSAWQSYLERSGLYQVLRDYDERLQQRLAEQRIATAAIRLKESRSSHTQRLKPAPGRGARGWFKSGLRVVGRGAVAAARSFGVDRGLAKLFAKFFGRSVPGVGWWLVGVDAIQSLSQAAREEIAARRLSQKAWTTDQRATCLRFIAGVEESILSALKEAERSILTTVQDHRKAAEQALDEIVDVRDSLLRIAASSDEATTACDRELVSALLAHDGFDLLVSQVRRVPNRSMEIAFDGAGDYKRAIEELGRHLAPETVLSATSKRLPVIARHARQIGRA